MKGDFLEREMRNIAALEECYRWAAELVKPAELQEDLLPAVRGYMSVLRGLERCVELRLKLVREAGRMPEPEPEERVATVDLSRLSDGALREVERAMVPELSVSEQLAREPLLPEPGKVSPEPGALSEEATGPEPEVVFPESAQGPERMPVRRDGAENGDDDRNGLCEKKICAAAAPPKDMKKGAMIARPTRTPSVPGLGRRNRSPSSG